MAAEASIESGEVGSRVGEEEDDDEGVWEVGDDENEKDEDEPVPMDHADDSEPHIPAASSCSQPSTASPSNAVDRAAQQLENLLTCVCPVPSPPLSAASVVSPRSRRCGGTSTRRRLVTGSLREDLVRGVSPPADAWRRLPDA